MCASSPSDWIAPFRTNGGLADDSDGLKRTLWLSGITLCDIVLMRYGQAMIVRKPLSVSLTPELHTFITELVKGGGYTSSSEVIRAGLRLLQHDESKRRPASESVGPSAVAGSPN